MNDFLGQAFIFLFSAVICVPISKKLGMGSVLGYLIAGVLIGPYVLKLLAMTEQTLCTPQNLV